MQQKKTGQRLIGCYAWQILILILIIPAFVNAQKNNYTIEGKIKTYDPGAFAYLNYVRADTVVLDSAIIKDGNFLLSGEMVYPVKARLFISASGIRRGVKKGNMLELFLESGHMMLNSEGYVDQAVISGSPLNDELDKFEQSLKTVNDSSEEIKPSAGFSFAGQGEKKKAYIAAHPDSYLSLFFIKDFTGRSVTPEVLESFYKGLSPRLQKSPEGKNLLIKIAALRTTGIGSLAPVFTQNDTLGRPVSLIDFRGKYVFLDFWASWCIPCRAENPHVVKAYNNYKDKNLVIIGISLDGGKRGKADWIEAIRKDNLQWTQLSDLKGGGNAVAKMYDVNSIPASFLIDPNGKIIAVNLRNEALDKKLQEVLK